MLETIWQVSQGYAGNILSAIIVAIIIIILIIIATIFFPSKGN